MTQLEMRNGRIITVYDDIDEFNHYETDKAVPWREFKIGDKWVIADDGYVHEVISTRKYGKGRVTVFVFRISIGEAIYRREHIKKDGELKITTSPKVLSGAPERLVPGFAKSGQKQKSKYGLSKREVLFARLVATQTDLTRQKLYDIYKECFPRSKSDEYIKHKSIVLFNSKEVQKVVREETLKMMDDIGVTEEWIVNKIRTIVESSKSNYSDKTRSLMLLAKIRGMLEAQTQKNTATLQIEGVIDHKRLLAIRDEETGKVDITK